MRISDWSSDVCSSDLRLLSETWPADGPPTPDAPAARPGAPRPATTTTADRATAAGAPRDLQGPSREPGARRQPRRRCASLRAQPRSEEHTSELQSLMRISYAVFCLKKKKIHQ